MFKVSGSTIYIYDDIGPAWLGMIDSGSIVDALEQIGEANRVSVRISSPGGDVAEGLAIFNALKRHQGGCDTYADGVAASCGSYIFAAGENRVVAENAMLMIHDPWGVSIGNAEEHRKTADVYDKFADNMARDYAMSAGKTVEAVRDLMQQEVWLNAEESVAEGFATGTGESVIEETPVIAQGRFAKTPESLVATVEAGSRTKYSVAKLRRANSKSSICQP